MGNHKWSGIGVNEGRAGPPRKLQLDIVFCEREEEKEKIITITSFFFFQLLLAFL